MRYKNINIFNATVGSVQQGDQNSAFVLQDTDEPDNDSTILDETDKLPKNSHNAWSFELKCGVRIKFEVDSDDPVNIFLTDSSSYEGWRNGSVMHAYDSRLENCRATGQFTSPRSGEYFLVISNEGDTKTKVDVLISII